MSRPRSPSSSRARSTRGEAARRVPAGRVGRAARAAVCHLLAAGRAGTVPEDAHLFLDFGGEATLWLDGAPAEALSSGPRQARMSVPVPAGERIFELELACNDPFGFGESGQGLAMRFELRRCERRGASTTRPGGRSTTSTFLLALEDVAEPEWAGELLAQLHAFTIDGDRARLDGCSRALRRDPPDVRDRARPPRHRLAVAARGDLPQADPHHDGAAAAARRLSRARLRPLAGAALRVAARPRAGALRAGARGGRRRAAGSPSAGPGSSPTATCRPASRWRASSSTASASSSASSAATARSSGTRTSSATPPSSRS